MTSITLYFLTWCLSGYHHVIQACCIKLRHSAHINLLVRCIKLNLEITVSSTYVVWERTAVQEGHLPPHALHGDNCTVRADITLPAPGCIWRKLPRREAYANGTARSAAKSRGAPPSHEGPRQVNTYFQAKRANKNTRPWG